MAVAINTVALEIAQRISDDKTTTNTVHTAGTEDGQRYTASARRSYINNANIELYNVLVKISKEFKDENQRAVLLHAYTTQVPEAIMAQNFSYTYSPTYEDVFMVRQRFTGSVANHSIPIPYFNAEKSGFLRLDFKDTYCWTKTDTEIFVFGESPINPDTGISWISALDVFAIKPPAAVSAGSNLTLVDSHKDLLEDIVLKNMYTDLFDLERVQLYNNLIKSKLTTLVRDL